MVSGKTEKERKNDTEREAKKPARIRHDNDVGKTEEGRGKGEKLKKGGCFLT